MTKPKWTPGPWYAGRYIKTGVFTDENVAGTVAECNLKRDTARADANLIAAAPELYEALAIMSDAHWHEKTFKEQRKIVREMAEPALAKARGETSDQ